MFIFDDPSGNGERVITLFAYVISLEMTDRIRNSISIRLRCFVTAGINGIDVPKLASITK